MTRLELHYEVHLRAPMHIGTGMGFAKMVDDLVVRAGPAKGDQSRLPCIPGSSLKGKIRSRCESLSHTLNLTVCTSPPASQVPPRLDDRGPRRCKRRLCVICRLFGSPYSPGHLSFSDALLVKEWQRVGAHLGRDSSNSRDANDPHHLAAVRAGNKIERAARTVESDFLFSSEQTADDLRYAGSIIGSIDPRPVEGLNLVLPIEAWLLTLGLQAVDKIGGQRSRGLGRCRITITSLKAGGEDLTADLDSLITREDYLLGVAEYET